MSKKHKNIAKCALIVALIPLAILIVLFVGNKIYELSGGTFYINILDIYNKELFVFSGSYLSGLSILIALYFIVKHYQEESQYHTYIMMLDKEKECIFSAVSKINPLAASNLYNQYSSLPTDANDYNRVKILEIKREINSHREQLMLAQTELQLKTDILDEYDKCAKCEKKCSIIKYAERFKEQYSEAEKIIYDFLISLEQYIDIDSENIEYQSLVAQLNKQLEAPRLTVAVKEDLTGQIAKYEGLIKDSEVLTKDLKVDMFSISQVHSEIRKRLILVAKGYYFAKTRDEYRAYLNVKSNDVKCKNAKH